MARDGAITATSPEYSVYSDTQSRNVLRKPCAVAATFIRRSTAVRLMSETGPRLAGNTLIFGQAIARQVAQELHRRLRKRHPMLASRLDPRRGDRPERRPHVDLRRGGPANLSGSSGRQHRELECQRANTLLRPQTLHERGNVPHVDGR